MNKRWLSVGLVFLMVTLLLAGCGISQDDYDAVVSERDSISEDLQASEMSLESTKMELQASKTELESIKTELQASKTELESMASELQSVNIEYNSVKDEFEALEKVYPPREFSSSTELGNWLQANDISEKPDTATVEMWYARALELQEDALKDGYIISVDVDPGSQEGEWYVSCVAVINGELWAWDPESDDIVEVSTILGWTKVK